MRIGRLGYWGEMRAMVIVNTSLLPHKYRMIALVERNLRKNR